MKNINEITDRLRYFVEANKKQHLDLTAYSLAISYLNEHAYDDFAMHDGQLLALLTNEGSKD